MKKRIEFKGQILETINHESMSQEMYLALKEEFYQKPSFELVKKQFRTLKNGGVKNNHVTNYYVKDLMAKTKVYYNKWCVEDVFDCKELVEFFYAKSLKNKKVFNSNSVLKNIETAIRLGGKGVANKVANYPIKSVDYILENYNTNDNYYDFSCGWGDRLISALKNNVNYYGTDPNFLLTERLLSMKEDFASEIGYNGTVEINSCGSEEYNPTWKNKMGLAFSSPPYFDLEDYKIGNQSYKEGVSYQNWLDNYFEKTIMNIYDYLIPYGYLLININNYKEYDLVGDCKNIVLNNGFRYIETIKLDNIKRTKSSGGFNDNSEGIMVFCKNG